MKYDKTTALGLNWAGEIAVRTAYDWDPVSALASHPAETIIGIEAPLWTETVATTGDLDFMAFPRSARSRRDCLVVAGIEALGGLSGAAGAPRAPLVGVGRQLLPLAGDWVAGHEVGERWITAQVAIAANGRARQANANEALWCHPGSAENDDRVTPGPP